jgi:DNA-binding transcriptional regulator YiaG
MPNIGSLLRSEITRLARKEVRQEVQTIRKLGAGYRRDIAALKRKVATLETQTKRLAKRPARAENVVSAAQDASPTRFVAKGLRSLRRRLGLSAQELARLLGVSMQSVYNWERKKSVPRRNQVTSIAGLRAISKAEAHARLENLRKPKRPKTTQHRTPVRRGRKRRAS